MWCNSDFQVIFNFEWLEGTTIDTNLNLGISGRDLIAGDQSFGAMLEQEGYFAVPSPRQPFPGTYFYYYNEYRSAYIAMGA